MKITKEQIIGVVRHALTFVGGVLVTKGLLDEAVWSEIVGSVLALVGSVWSIFDKK